MPSHPIDLTPLLHGAGARQLRVAGVVAGEAALRVDRAVLTGAAEKDIPPGHVHTNGTVYRTNASGEREEVPLEERVEATLLGRGVLRMGEVALSVAEGVITRIFVRGPALDALRVTREADIERLLGPAEGKERQYGNHLFHYPARGVVIAWGGRAGRLDHVALGHDPWEEPRLGAPELLAELLGIARGSTSATDIWHPLLTPTPDEPRTLPVRRERVAALCRALGLGAPAEVVQGAFLCGAVDEGRQRVLDELAAHSPLPERRPYVPPSLVFTHLLLYRHDAERVIRATSGWLECGDPALLGMIAVQNRIAGQLTTALSDVDRWLCALLDPSGRSFRMGDLITTYGWPDVDLFEVELDDV